MKRIIVLFVAVSAAFISEAQITAPETKETSGQKTRMFGLNATSFVKNFLSFNDINPSTNDAFEFTFRCIGPKNIAFRSNLGLLFSSTTATVSNDDDETSLNFFNLNLALGVEKRTNLSERWLCYWGIDALIGVEMTKVENKSGSFSSKDEDSVISGGIAPVVGVQFNINDRISVSTEGSLGIKYSVTENKSTNDDESASTEIKSISLATVLPTFVYFNIKF